MGGMTRCSSRIGVAIFKRSNGRLAGGTDEAPVLLLTTPGRRTGEPRSVCVRTLPVAGGWLVWGTASGATSDPQWFRNLRAAGRCEVQLGSERFVAAARELHGADRDRAWNETVLARLPDVAKYERRARRTIPVALLTTTSTA